MPTLIECPTTIPVPGNKVIEEFAGRVRTGETKVSVARMVAPIGWSEPGQTPTFEEITLVLRGRLIVETKSETITVDEGQAIITHPGEWVRYSTPLEETEYVAICVPAFSPEEVNRDEE